MKKCLKRAMTYLLISILVVTSILSSVTPVLAEEIGQPASESELAPPKEEDKSEVRSSRVATTSSYATGSESSSSSMTSTGARKSTDVSSSTSLASNANQVKSTQAQSDISNHITSLKVVDRTSKRELAAYQDGAYLNVKGRFDDTKGKINGGDYIKITWPTSGQALINGFNGIKDLYIDGTLVGNYAVNAAGAKLTFNDNIDNLNNVHGEFSFDVQVRNFSQSDQIISFSAGTIVTTISARGVPVSGRSDIDGKTWRGDKVGIFSNYQGENIIIWGVRLNSNCAPLASDIYFEDTIEPGQSLQANQLELQINDGASIKFKDFNQRFPDSKVEIVGDTIKARFSAKEFSQRKLTVRYVTSIVDKDLATFDNSAEVSYQLANEARQTINYNKSVQNINFDASVTGTKPGELRILKKLRKKKSVIPGVTFEITGPTGNKFNETTDENGIIDINNLSAGRYTVREVAAPANIDLDAVKDKRWYIDVSDKRNGYTKVIYNDAKKESVPWTDYSNTKSKVVIPWTDYSNTKSKVVIPWTDYSNNKSKVVIPWTDYSNTKSKVVIPWTDYSNNKSKTVIPWTDYSNTKSKVVIPWIDYSNTKSKVVIPWTDYSNTKSKVVIPWTDYSNSKSKTVIPWTDYSNTKSKVVIPWTDYSNNKSKVVIPWTDYSNTKSKVVIPWTDYSNNKSKTVIPWTDYSNTKSKVVIPWTDYSNTKSKVVIPWTDYSNSKSKTVIPWTDYSNTKSKVVIPWTDYSNTKSKTVIPWTDYSNNKSKTVIPWIDYSNTKSKTVIPWTDYSNNKSKTVIPWIDYSNTKSKTVIPWTDYSNNKSKTVIPWTDITPRIRWTGVVLYEKKTEPKKIPLIELQPQTITKATEGPKEVLVPKVNKNSKEVVVTKTTGQEVNPTKPVLVVAQSVESRQLDSQARVTHNRVNQAELPQTDEITTPILQLIGLCLSLVGCVGLLFFKKITIN